MKSTVLLLVSAFFGLILAKTDYKIADKDFVTKQKEILRLFKHTNQASDDKDLIEIANNFKFDDWEQYTKTEPAKQFWHDYQSNIVPKDGIFTPLHLHIMWPSKDLFSSLYYAKDYETFYKIAVWARQNVNAGAFIYALSIAVIYSKWTKDIILPPIYEINPNYFFKSDVIFKAQQSKQSDTIEANYTEQTNSEQLLNYYTEDIGLNSDYYYANILLPYWVGEKMQGYKATLRGEFFFYYHQQKLARYYLERLSNGLDDVPYFSYEKPIETGFNPSLIYPNGNDFPIRPNFANLRPKGNQKYGNFGNHTYYTYENVIIYEQRLRDAIDAGFFFKPDGEIVWLFNRDGLGHLANLIECNGDTLNDRLYLDITLFARYILGYSKYPLEQHKLVPSALEQLETSMRDPVFYQFIKRLLYFYYQHQTYTAPYDKKELLFEQVKIDDFTVDKLITYFDHFTADITNSLKPTNIKIKAKQLRLNHDPFNYTIKVTSNKPIDSLIKIFIGPKYDTQGNPINIDESRRNFFEIDRFHQKLTIGTNEIKRSSKDSKYFSNDRTTFDNFLEQLNSDEFKIYDQMKYYGFPDRLMLPKGTVGGQTFQFFVMVAPYHAPSEENTFTKYFLDTEYTIGYPLDRPIHYEDDFFVPNFYFKDVQIYHKRLEGVNPIWSNH